MHETLSLNPGLILLRYKMQGGQANAIIRVVVPSESRGTVTLLFDPANRDDALTAPGEICILRCSRACKITLEISSRQQGIPPRGSIEVEYLSQPRRGSNQSPSFRAAPVPTVAFDYMAHFNLLGDQRASFGEWLKGDGTSQGIEGLSLNNSSGQPRIMMRDLVSGQTAAPGEFLGSRGCFRPLTEIEVWIDDLANTNVIHVEAEFRNAGRITQAGSFLTLRGVEPNEKLLAINLRIAPRDVQSAPIREQGFRSGRTQPPQNERVKIFRK